MSITLKNALCGQMDYNNLMNELVNSNIRKLLLQNQYQIRVNPLKKINMSYFMSNTSNILFICIHKYTIPVNKL